MVISGINWVSQTKVSFDGSIVRPDPFSIRLISLINFLRFSGSIPPKYSFISPCCRLVNMGHRTFTRGSWKKTYRFLLLVSLNMRKYSGHNSSLYGSSSWSTSGISYFFHIMRCELIMMIMANWLRWSSAICAGTPSAWQKSLPCTS
mgnify:CR=1 FL=1